MSTPTVRFECETCGWTHHVPADDIVLVAGIPHSKYIPEHECAEGAALLERSGYDVDLVVEKPSLWARLKL